MTATTQVIGNGHVPDSWEVIAVLVWHEIKRIGLPVLEVARKAGIDEGAIYGVLTQRQRIGSERFAKLSKVLTNLKGVAAPSGKKNAIDVTDTGIAMYNQLVREDRAVLFKQDPVYGHAKRRSRGASVKKNSPNKEPKAPVQATKQVVVVERRHMGTELLRDLLFLLSDQSTKAALGRVAVHLKKDDIHLADVLPGREA